jgi:hypothetical protein
MAEVIRHAPGRFCWVELSTTDAAAARRFYANLFGWYHSLVPLGDGSFYNMLRCEGKEVAALYQLYEQQRSQGAKPQWLLYIATNNVDETIKRVPELGGKVLIEPFDVQNGGRMAVAQDPTGAAFALWQAREHVGAQLINHPGALCWQELSTTDAQTAEEFYAKLLGWQARTVNSGAGSYKVFSKDGSETGGLSPLKQERKADNPPPHWTAYFAVEDCQASVRTAVSLGGKVQTPPTEVPGIGQFAVIQDPQGAVFSIIKPSGLHAL